MIRRNERGPEEAFLATDHLHPRETAHSFVSAMAAATITLAQTELSILGIGRS